MENGTPVADGPSGSEEHVIRPAFRSGLKRELAFVLESYSQFPSSLGRTRSGKTRTPIVPNSTTPPRDDSNSKRFKKSDGEDELLKRSDPLDPATPPPPPPPPEMMINTPVVIDTNDEPVVFIGPPEKPTRRFTRSLLKVKLEDPVATTPPRIEQTESAIETPIVIDGQDCSPLMTPTRRITRLWLKVTSEDPAAVDVSSKMSGGSVRLEGMKGVTNADIGSPRMTPKKKMELKMSKKIALTKFPTQVRELLETGLLEGLSVKCFPRSDKQDVLEGVIKDGCIMCSCTSCKGLKAISAYQFVKHSGSSSNHPSYLIYLENGRTICDVLKACTSAPLDMLEATIQNAIGQVLPKKSSTCRNCKGTFHTSRTGKLAVLCDSCRETKQPKKTSSPSSCTAYSGRLSRPVLVPDSVDSASKNTSSQKKNSLGRLTKKDVRLHKLGFIDDILPDGTEVAYYARGQRMLEGYIKAQGIFCFCCNAVVCPSVFEAHAGFVRRRKPYHHIYTSNGVSLHELAVSLSKGRKLSVSETDDLCRICADGGNLLLCDVCPRAFHKECVGLSSIPKGDWYCPYCQIMHQNQKFVAHNDNAIAAGRVEGVDPIEQIFKRCIRIIKTPETDVGGCVLCRSQDFSKSKFGQRTVLLCDQCEKEYHVGCLKDHYMGDLKELPKGKWFCCTDCSRIHAALQDLLLRGSEMLPGLHSDIIRRKHEEKGLNKDADVDVRWRLLGGKNSSAESRLLLSKAVSIFHECFDPIVDFATGRDLIPSMVYGRERRDQHFGGMHCAVLTVNSSVVSAGILRVLGCEVAELPLVATRRERQGLGYFQCLFSCIERLLVSLKVKHFVLPATDEAESIWTKKLGFTKISPDKLHEYTKGSRTTIFQGTSMLHKLVPESQASV